MLSRLSTILFPATSFPIAIAKLEENSINSFDAITFLIGTIDVFSFCASIPMVVLPEIGASICKLETSKLSFISSSNLRISLILTPFSI